MEEVLSYSRPKLRDHFEAFLLGQKVGADLNKDDRSADSSDNSSELEESLPRKEVHIKTERFENDAASNPGFSVVRIKTEKLDEDHVRVKTEKADPVEAICQPTSSASPVPCRIEVKKEKEDIVSIKTEEIDGRNENEGTRQDEYHANPPSGGIVKQIKTEGDDSSDEFDIKRVKMERISDAQTISQQQITGGCRSSQDREVGDSPPGQNDDEVESPSHSPITLRIKEETAEHDEMKGLYEASNVSKQPDGPQPTDLEEYTHQRSSDRKAKNIAKMMLKNLEENLNFIDGKDRKTPRSKSFVSSLKLHEMNNDFVKYKSAFSLQECSVKIQRLSEEILDQYGVNLDEIRMDEKVDVQTLKKGLFSCSECSFRSHHVKELRDHQWKHRTDTAYHQCRECL
ncbi:hypothetical protein GE061_011380 [Apolygus lucorum]|uniref:Uncharacterized protein n=1 Tax=Apolygus lucorum TaxID=248454 RepID=A0A6A4JZ41_APOLU|nr:hypothetical protein GE061_011380 [Apolygus lucorum]